MTKLGADDWRRVFTRLAELLPPPRERRMIVIGGLAMALEYDSRRTTDDADAVIPPDIAAELIAAADRIAGEFQLPQGWLNQKALEAEKIVPPQPDHAVFRAPTLVLEVPSAGHMLAMKVARFAGDIDSEDAKVLLLRMRARHSDVEDVWTEIGGLVPVAQRDRARHYLLTLWDELDESA